MNFQQILTSKNPLPTTGFLTELMHELFYEEFWQSYYFHKHASFFQNYSKRNENDQKSRLQKKPSSNVDFRGKNLVVYDIAYITRKDLLFGSALASPLWYSGKGKKVQWPLLCPSKIFLDLHHPLVLQDESSQEQQQCA